MKKEEIEEILSKYPILQYEFCRTEEVTFSDKVREICRTECDRYGKSWSCPPGVGTVEECKNRCLAYPNVCLYTTQAEVSDTAVFAEALASRTEHEKITREVLADMRAAGAKCFALSGESCQICEQCAYPHACRHPEQMIPCIESYGILVVNLTEKYGIEFYTDSHTVTWFGMIFYL